MQKVVQLETHPFIWIDLLLLKIKLNKDKLKNQFTLKKNPNWTTQFLLQQLLEKCQHRNKVEMLLPKECLITRLWKNQWWMIQMHQWISGIFQAFLEHQRKHNQLQKEHQKQLRKKMMRMTKEERQACFREKDLKLYLNSVRQLQFLMSIKRKD